MTIIKKFDPEQYQAKFPKKYIALAVIGLFILTLIEVWAANTVVEFGGKFDSISTLKQALQMENQILLNEIAKNSSLNSVASQSAALGFSKMQSIQYIR